MKQFLLNLCALPTLSNIYLDIAWRDLKRSCHQTNSSYGGFVRKVPFYFFYYCYFFYSCFYVHLYFFQGFPGQLDGHLTIPWQWDVVLGFLLAGISICASVYSKHFYSWNINLVSYCSGFASKNDKMKVCSDTNVKTTPCKCCMHSSGMVKLSTGVISDVCISYSWEY